MKILGEICYLWGYKGVINVWESFWGRGPLALGRSRIFLGYQPYPAPHRYYNDILFLPQGWRQDPVLGKSSIYDIAIKDAKAMGLEIREVSFQELVEFYYAIDLKRWLKEWDRRTQAGMYGLTQKQWEQNMRESWMKAWPDMPLPAT